jgi:hypothetical protein
MREKSTKNEKIICIPSVPVYRIHMAKNTIIPPRPSDVYAAQPHILYTKEDGKTYIKLAGLDDGEDPEADGWQHKGRFATWDAAAITALVSR